MLTSLKYFFRLVILFFILLSGLIIILMNFKLLSKSETRTITSIALKINQINKKREFIKNKSYWNYIELSESEISLIERKGLDLRYKNKMYFFVISEGFDNYYYYNLTKRCWHDDIVYDKYFLFLPNCIEKERYR